MHWYTFDRAMLGRLGDLRSVGKVHQQNRRASTYVRCDNNSENHCDSCHCTNRFMKALAVIHSVVGEVFELHDDRCNFTNSVVPIWNSLSNHVVSADTVNTFKHHLDKFWLNQKVMMTIMFILVLNVCLICSPLLIVKVIFVITVFFLFFMCFYHFGE